MTNTVVRLFDDLEEAQRAIQALLEAGFQKEDISLIASDFRGDYKNHLESDKAQVAEKGEETAGMTETGAVVGGLLGLMAGLGVLGFPALGPVLIGGPLLATLAGAGAGAAGGALLGALADVGLTEDEAQYFAEAVRRGGVLVLVHTDEENAPRALRTMDRYNIANLEQRVEDWRREGWRGWDPDAEPYEPSEIDRMRAQTGHREG